MITKTLNEAFGYDGWCLEVKNTTREEPIKDDKGRYLVAYIATVRITHRHSGVFREDCGAGDAIDRSLASASGNALKGAVTDAMKRAARHFGEKLGNSLYHDGFNANNAPPTLKDALDTLDIDRAKSRFGFAKDQKKVAAAQNTVVKNVNQHNKQQQPAKQVAKTPYNTQQTPRTQYVGNITTTTNQSNKPNNAKPHVTPHGTANATAHNTTSAAALSSTQNPSKPSNTYVTPGNKATASNNKKPTSTFDSSMFDDFAAGKTVNTMKENTNPQQTGLALPPRPGTSRGTAASAGANSPTSAYIASFSGGGGGNGATPSMFGAGGTMSQALVMEQQQGQSTAAANTTSLAQSLKRKSESMDNGSNAGQPVVKSQGGARNPYCC